MMCTNTKYGFPLLSRLLYYQIFKIILFFIIIVEFFNVINLFFIFFKIIKRINSKLARIAFDSFFRLQTYLLAFSSTFS